MSTYQFGIVGLGVMGENLALNVESRGYPAAGYDLDEKKRQSAAEKWAGKKMATVGSLAELAAAIGVGEE